MPRKAVVPRKCYFFIGRYLLVKAEHSQFRHSYVDCWLKYDLNMKYRPGILIIAQLTCRSMDSSSQDAFLPKNAEIVYSPHSTERLMEIILKVLRTCWSRSSAEAQPHPRVLKMCWKPSRLHIKVKQNKSQARVVPVSIARDIQRMAKTVQIAQQHLDVAFCVLYSILLRG